jgi:hypothetical protein
MASFELRRRQGSRLATPLNSKLTTSADPINLASLCYVRVLYRPIVYEQLHAEPAIATCVHHAENTCRIEHAPTDT